MVLILALVALLCIVVYLTGCYTVGSHLQLGFNKVMKVFFIISQQSILFK